MTGWFELIAPRRALTPEAFSDERRANEAGSASCWSSDQEAALPRHARRVCPPTPSRSPFGKCVPFAGSDLISRHSYRAVGTVTGSKHPRFAVNSEICAYFCLMAGLAFRHRLEMDFRTPRRPKPCASFRDTLGADKYFVAGPPASKRNCGPRLPKMSILTQVKSSDH